MGNIESTIMGFTEKGQGVLDTLFGGVIKDEVIFIKNVRAAAYETAGVTGESKNLQKAYEDIGKTVHLTGVDRSAFQTAYINNLKGGIRDMKQAQNIAISQLNTEKQLGLKAGDLSVRFQEWALAGRMTEMQIADMGRGMREVARNTGLTGEELKKAVGTSQSFIDNLRASATLTAAAAKNVLEIVANARSSEWTKK